MFQKNPRFKRAACSASAGPADPSAAPRNAAPACLAPLTPSSRLSDWEELCHVVSLR